MESAVESVIVLTVYVLARVCRLCLYLHINVSACVRACVRACTRVCSDRPSSFSESCLLLITDNNG